ncbi:MAG: sel1 repeat family protein [Rhodospirillales bacterium]|nr:sel1 repeat family protein [Rhodospirillales bacterium]
MRYLATLVGALLATWQASADTTAGRDAFQVGDYGTAAREWSEAARAGEADAQYGLAWCLQFGKGVGQDTATAAYWYEKAARQGHADAAYAMGLLSENGDGVTKDFAQALAWYTAAARFGVNPEAEYAVARLYQRGLGSLRDDEAAMRWFRRAADHGHPAAQYVLGAAYELGWGVPANAGTAYYWYSLADRAGPAKLRNYDPTFDAAAAVARLRPRLPDYELRRIDERLRAP